jgi:hypothetical protein
VTIERSSIIAQKKGSANEGGLLGAILARKVLAIKTDDRVTGGGESAAANVRSSNIKISQGVRELLADVRPLHRMGRLLARSLSRIELAKGLTLFSLSANLQTEAIQLAGNSTSSSGRQAIRW